MNLSNVISFDIYLLLIVCFLCIMCYLISTDLIISILNNIKLFKLRDTNKSNTANLLDILGIAKIYILRNQWLSCILMLEYVLLQDKLKENLIEYYNCLAFCFCKLDIYDKAEKYYILSLKNYPGDINTLYCLANLYTLYNKPIKAREMYQNILRIDPTDTTVKKYLDTITM